MLTKVSLHDPNASDHYRQTADDKPSCRSLLKSEAVNVVANFYFWDGKVRFHPSSTTNYVIHRVLDLG